MRCRKLSNERKAKRKNALVAEYNDLQQLVAQCIARKQTLL